MLSKGAQEDLKVTYEAGYDFGFKDGRKAEADRILALIELDLMVPDNVKSRIKDLVNGNSDD